MRSKKILILLLIGFALITIPLLFTSEPVEAMPTGFTYYKVITVANYAGGNGYQLLINVTNSSGGNVTCGGHVKQSDFGDVHFYDIDNTTELKYWRLSYNANTYANFWVKLPTDVSTDQKILMVYGSTTKHYTGDPDDVFLAWDNFDDYTVNTLPNASRGWNHLTSSSSQGYMKVKSSPVDSGTDYSLMLHQNASGGYYYMANFFPTKNINQSIRIYIKIYVDTLHDSWVWDFYSNTHTIVDSNVDKDNSYNIRYDDGSWKYYSPTLNAPLDTLLDWRMNIWQTDNEIVSGGTRYDGGLYTAYKNASRMYFFMADYTNIGEMYIDDFYVCLYNRTEPYFSSFSSEKSTATAHTPTITNAFPSNNTEFMNRYPRLSVNVSDTYGGTVDVFWYTNASGSYTKIQTNSSVPANSTVRLNNFTQASKYKTKYYWKVYANDTLINTSSTFSFTTKGTPTVTTNNAFNVEETSATLNGTISNDWGQGGTLQYQYGLTSGYGSTIGNITEYLSNYALSNCQFGHATSSYVYGSAQSVGLYAFTFNGKSFTYKGQTSSSPNFGSTTGGGYVYVCLDTSGVYAYTFSGSSFTYKGSKDDGGNYADCYHDGTYLYCACGNSGLRAYSFDGTTFTLKDTDDVGDGCTDVWGDGTYIYATVDDMGIAVYRFNGTAFTLLDIIDNGDNFFQVHGDSNYIYAISTSDGLFVYSFNGTTLSLITNQDDGGTYYGLYTDNNYIYTGCDTSGIRAYIFNGTTLSLYTTINNGLTNLNLFGYGDYVYVPVWSNGLNAYKMAWFTGNYHNVNLTGLSSGSRYHFRALANNTNGTGYGSDSTFLTKPNTPSNFSVGNWRNTTRLLVSWNNASHGTGVNMTTYIRYDTTTYPTTRALGTYLYNGTGNSTNITNWLASTTYYVSAWHFVNCSGVSKWSDTYVTDSFSTGATVSGLTVTSIRNNTINLSWTNGAGKTVIRRGLTDPTSPTSGTEVYNGTSTSCSDTGLSTSTKYYYRAFCYNTSLKFFYKQNVSLNQYTRPNKPYNLNVTVVSYNTINITWTNGSGATITVIRKSTSSQPTTPTSGTELYNGTKKYKTDSAITGLNNFYTLFAYNSTTHQFSEASPLIWYVVWVNVYDETTNASISNWNISFANSDGTQTYTKKACNNPTLFNISDIPQGDNIGIFVVAKNYESRQYYQDIDIEGNYNINLYLSPSATTHLYYCQVVTTYNIPLKSVLMQFKRSVNGSDYTLVDQLLTDDTGYVNLYLEGGVNYKVILTKSGYNTSINDWTTDPFNYGIYYPKVFILYVTQTSYTPTEYVWTNITYSYEPENHYQNKSYIIWYNVTSSDSKLQYASGVLYYYNTTLSTYTIVSSQNLTGTSSVSLSFTVPDVEGKYVLASGYKKTGFSYNTLGYEYYYVYHSSSAEESAQDIGISDDWWLGLTIIFMILGMGAVAPFIGANCGIVGITIQGIMFGLRPALTVFSGDTPISCWFLFAATVIGFFFIMWITRGR